MFQVTNKALLPQENLKQVKKDLHVWVVTDGEWSYLKLPYRGMGPNEMMHYISGVFSKLQFPLKVSLLVLFSEVHHLSFLLPLLKITYKSLTLILSIKKLDSTFLWFTVTQIKFMK